MVSDQDKCAARWPNDDQGSKWDCVTKLILRVANSTAIFNARHVNRATDSSALQRLFQQRNAMPWVFSPDRATLARQVHRAPDSSGLKGPF
jgi:hypothetical protein